MSDIRELPVVEPASTVLPEEPTEQQVERRYLSVINPLLSEAYEQRHMETFVDVLTWTLARVIVAHDKPWVTGDILRRIGNYTCRITESNRAEAEAKAAKEEGRLPN